MAKLRLEVKIIDSWAATLWQELDYEHEASAELINLGARSVCMCVCMCVYMH